MTKDQIRLAIYAIQSKREDLLILLEDPRLEDNVQEFEMEIDELDQCAAALSRLTPTDL